MTDETKQPVFLSTMPADGRQRRLALTVVLLSLSIFIAAVPFARLQLPAMWAFIPIYESTLAINDLITASLLFVQFSILRRRALLALACGFLFAAVMVVPHALTFPGLFSDAGLLGAGPQTTAWLYMFWHGVFPLLVTCYAMLKTGDRDTAQPRGSVRTVVFFSVVAVLALAGGLTLLATTGQAHLPGIMQGNSYTPAMIVVVTTVGALGLVALAMLWRQRPHTVLDLWLMVVMCAWTFDVALSAIFNAGRFDLGFYAGRIYGLLASTFVLLVLLFETEKLYAQLAWLFEAEQVDRKRQLEEGRRIFDTSLDLILVTDRQGHFIRVSPSSAAILGYRPEELTGHSAAEFICPEDLEPTRNEMRLARRGHETRNFHTRYVHKDGHPVSLAWTGVWSEPEQRHFFIGRDMTEQNKAQEALKHEAEERQRVAEVLRNTIASMVDPVLVAGADGKVLVVNPPAQKIFGTLVGVDSDKYTRNYDRFYPDGVTPFPFEQTALYRAVRGESVDDLEFIVQPKGATDGFYLVASGRPIRNAAGELQGAVTIFRDITARRKTQEALLESERMARDIIAGALDGFTQINESGEVTEWNPRAEEIFGWTRQEALGKRLNELFLPGDYRPVYRDMIAALQNPNEKAKIGRRIEIDAVRKDGEKLKVEVAITPLRRRDGYVFNGFIKDLTDKFAAEEQLRQAQKMESIGQLTGGIAHDFNNMLTAITGTIDILADAVADKPQLAAIAKLISEAADRGADLTGQLLAFARKQPLQPRETDIYELLIETTNLLRPTLGEHIEIETKLQNDIWPALIDPGQLSNALLNLAVNARDAMPNGGKLMIEADNVVLDEDLAETIGDIQPGHYVVIAVSDTGSGIPAAIRAKVFEPFFTTKDIGKGTGLGLSMVYGFVKQSGGHIKVYSEEGHGTTFRIYLPQAGDLPIDQFADETLESSIAGGNETVLIVEDDTLVRNSVTTQLQGLGYRTLSAGNAAEALAIADSGAAFDLLFTDVIMPGKMNGRQLADEMAKRRSPLKVLFTSGYTEDAIIHHGRLDPGVFLLAKPYRKSELAHMVRRALGAAETSPARVQEPTKSQTIRNT